MIIKNILLKCLGFYVLPILLILSAFQVNSGGFKKQQQGNSRVKKAYEEKWDGLKKMLDEKKVNPSNMEMLIRAFKEEKKLEVWLKNKADKKYLLFKEYDICATSGSLGPKRKEGDGQVPEGFYKISAFNPASNYHLSLKVNYPNESDVIKGKKPLGGDIMIHGNCVTIGCMPLTDDKIKEVYILAVETKNGNNEIKVDSYPCKLSIDKLAKLKVEYGEALFNFWNSLKPQYDYFETNHALKVVKIDSKGNYIF